MKNITVKGAQVHNLKDIDIAIPKNKLIVATGVSGSGKSSLVFDIIFEEGRRQYLQSLGILSKMDDEDKFDSISGIGPTIAVQQSIIRQSNSRSTVGSRTHLLNMLGLLYAREGKISCFSCGTPVNDKLICETCGQVEERLQANYFSYNHPNGMCIKCSGRGSYFEINMEKLVPNDQTTLRQVFETVGLTPGYKRLLSKRFKDYMAMPFSSLPDEVKEDIIYGHHVTSNQEKRSYCLSRLFKGRLYRQGDDMGGIYQMSTCSECQGYRIGEEARHVHLNGKHIGELGKMTITELHGFLEILLTSDTLTPLGKNLLKDILRKTSHLIKYRLGHLSLYREMPTLSGGEIQRLFLNAHLDSKMDSLIYILDEPTAGLHECEKSDLFKSIQELKAIGNTVIVVEHDKHMIQLAEHVIDIGPKAGIEGGQVIYQGNVEGLLKCQDSITGQYLSGQAPMPMRTTRQQIVMDKATPCITISHAKTNNLKDVTVSFPLGALVGIAGMSGSGKSSLISDTLVPLLRTYFHGQGEKDTSDIAENDEAMDRPMVKTLADKLEGAKHITGYAEVSQAPIGRNMNSNPATYIGIWDKIRKLFARQPKAIAQHLSAGHFSFNSKGACSECGGSGKETIWLGGNFSTHTTCKACHGKRYSHEALSVTYKGKNIYDVLDMSVSEAITFFEEEQGMIKILKVMERIGMGYIKLGQPTPTFSGGEAQRIKLAKEIGKRRKGKILYVLDEPTTGLSLYDTAKLIQLLDELIAKGNSVLIIEHDPIVLASCDWLIELGPEGGAEGGMLIAEGQPKELKQHAQSIIGRYL
ncbi:excinuclease ABC subunit UvrA [Vallitalea pronyensis]|uniref:UvrABC system protein A n=1 Tax=Vallitalea pronyensis TaxID=1348613 RepID=A0A8J8MPI3_9FIRM|nr:excinuclease ABC subunit UvrA [Vallitalea pronyensis]QUI25254.1 excinuclease ABC subunit UvrA [Vallitalea pronyensis]